MDLEKIFLKDACPTKIGGQAIIEGIMMRGEKRIATAVRLPNRKIHLKTEPVKPLPKIAKVPILRGVVVFIGALVQGTKTLMYSADILEKYSEDNMIESNSENATADGDLSEPGACCDSSSVARKDKSKKKRSFGEKLEAKIGQRAMWNIMLYSSVAVALLFSVVIFVIGPTWVVNFAGKFIESSIVLNLIEGVFRIILFILYILAISRMEDIHRVFQYHGAEHKTIHCYENNLELTPANCRTFYTLHPRCGTSFLMFVMIIALILFSLLGWPGLLFRILSRLLLIPVIAGLSFELLRWAGQSSSRAVKILSMPGIMLQKLTTAEPQDEHLEVAITAMNAVLVDDNAPYFEGIVVENAETINDSESEEGEGDI